jgi:protein-arginine kinase activator protein McsA
MLAGVLPEWAEDGNEDRRGPVEACTLDLSQSVDNAAETLKEWIHCAKAGNNFMQHRHTRRGGCTWWYRPGASKWSTATKP